MPVFGAEHQMHNDERKGLWHGDKFRAKGPVYTSLGRRPSSMATQFLRAKGPVYNSLGQRPRNRDHPFSPSANGAVHPSGIDCDGVMNGASAMG